MRLEAQHPLQVIGGLLSLLLAVGSSAPDATAATVPGQGVRTLLLIRHGAYDEADPRDPDSGRALTEEGREQARLTGERLAAFPPGVDVIHTSTMTRARETAGILGTALRMAPGPSRLIRECTPPTEREDIMAREKAPDLAACRDTLEQAWQRFFRPSPERDSVEVLVAHGNVIRYLTGKALGLDPLRWLRMGVGNCSITAIRVRPDGRCQVLAVGDVGHLPPRLQTRLWTPAPATARPAAADTVARPAPAR